MRKQFVACMHRNQAKHECPWAAVIAKAEGGYWCFESRDDWTTWRGQR